MNMLDFRQICVLFFLIEGVIYFLLRGSGVLFPVLFLVLFAYLILFFFSMRLTSNFYLKAKNNAKKGCVVLGFDDGPSPETTVKILDILAEHRAKAVFFLIGKNAIQYPNIVREIINRGHLVGGHTLNHSANFGTLNLTRAEEEIMGGINVVEGIISQKITLFRPPFGVSNPVIAAIIKKNDLEVVGWNIRSYDTINKDTKKMLKRITNKIKDGSSILLHDRVQNTVEILPDILKDIQNKKLHICPEIDW
ncbi:MAG: polysaccharide deacetylase family protein [Gammaproteobacteria bacterium]|nr:polysaccharide deacetylase family protein [Gammaproteobacteria bacterium]MBT6575132.1 polysaccharide deacetylase family protein [Gammaproteobacteria bacterium]